jgi:hypothetical protein
MAGDSGAQVAADAPAAGVTWNTSSLRTPALVLCAIGLFGLCARALAYLLGAAPRSVFMLVGDLALTVLPLVVYRLLTAYYPQHVDVSEAGVSIQRRRHLELMPWDQVRGFRREGSKMPSATVSRFSTGAVANEVALLTEHGIIRIPVRGMFGIDKVAGDPETVIQIIEKKLAERLSQEQAQQEG